VSWQTIRVERKDACAWVTLARPDARNALDDVLVRELTGAFEDLAKDTTVRAVVLTGDGPAFCAGADISHMRKAGTMTLAENEDDALRLSRMFSAWSDMPCPTLVLGHGAALGGGTGFLAGADVAIAESGCKLGFTEVRLGLIPSVISQVVIPAIGAHRARRWFLTGEVFDARRGLEIGLVSEVVPDGEGRARIEALRGIVASAGPAAVREAKALVRRYRGAPEGWPTNVDLSRTIARLRGGAEAREGLTAFLEKRDPAWKSSKPGSGA
jgi:methylglutaconyl-CoA hydratase